MAIIGLTLSDGILESVHGVPTASAMWATIQNIFERHSLLNKITARRNFYTAEMNSDEKILQFSNRIIHLAAKLKSMGVDVDDYERAMAFLNGIPERFSTLISALDALGTEDFFGFDFVTSKALQKEARLDSRVESSTPFEESALTAKGMRRSDRQRPRCDFCNRPGHFESTCWKKHPHLKPQTSRPDRHENTKDSSEGSAL